MIQYVFEVFLIIILFFLFGFIHSLTASLKVKEFLTKTFGELIAFYRLAYNLISIILFYIFLEAAPKPDITIYDLPSPFDLYILIPQFLSLAGIFWALKYFCFKEFIGINQIKRWYNVTYNLNEYDEHLTLRIEGPYRYSRHPLYFFSILFLVFRPSMSLFYLTILVCIIAYFYIGSFYEEKKLIKFFGDEYRSYQKIVPRIFPFKIFQPFKH
jgi:methanethiol S-methyltransferase